MAQLFRENETGEEEEEEEDDDDDLSVTTDTTEAPKSSRKRKGGEKSPESREGSKRAARSAEQEFVEREEENFWRKGSAARVRDDRGEEEEEEERKRKTATPRPQRTRSTTTEQRLPAGESHPAAQPQKADEQLEARADKDRVKKKRKGKKKGAKASSPKKKSSSAAAAADAPPASSASDSDYNDTAIPAVSLFTVVCPVHGCNTPPARYHRPLYDNSGNGRYTLDGISILLDHIDKVHTQKVADIKDDATRMGERQAIWDAHDHVFNLAPTSHKWALHPCGRLYRTDQKEKTHAGPCLSETPARCSADEMKKGMGIRPTDRSMYGPLTRHRLNITEQITSVLSKEQIAWVMAAPGPMPEWLYTHADQRAWTPFKNFYASFLDAAQAAEKKGNTQLEDALLETMVVAAKVVFRSTSSKGFTSELWAQMAKRVEMFGNDPVEALGVLVDEFTRSAASRIMPVHSVEQVFDNRCRRVARAARDGNLTKAGMVLQDDSVRADLGHDDVLQQMKNKLHATRIEPGEWLTADDVQAGDAAPAAGPAMQVVDAAAPAGDAAAAAAADDGNAAAAGADAATGDAAPAVVAQAAEGDAAANADGAAQADAGANENGWMGDEEEFKEISLDSLTRALKSGSAAGPDGLPPILLRRLMEEDDKCMMVLTSLATRMARGKLPPRFAQLMASGCAFALEKPGTGKVRPICITPCLRRAVASVMANRIGPSAAQWMAPHQHAVKIRDGANIAVSTARVAMEAHPESWIGLSVDIKNAFSSVDHAAVEEALDRAGGMLRMARGFFRQMYHPAQCPAVLIPPQQGHPPTVLSMDAKRGVMQGCGMSMLFFCAALQGPIDAAVRAADLNCPAQSGDGFKNGLAPTYADDIQAYGTPRWVGTFYQTLKEGLGAASLEVSVEKSKLFDYRLDAAMANAEMNDRVNALADELQLPLVKELTALGIPFGSPAFVQQQLEQKAEEIGDYCEKIGQLHDKEVALRMLTKSATAKASYLLRLLPPGVTSDAAKACSAHLRLSMRALLGDGLGPGMGANEEMDDPPPPPPDASVYTKTAHLRTKKRAQYLREVVELPTRCGGMGLDVPDTHINAAFLAGRASFTEHMRLYMVPWRLAMEAHMRDESTQEGAAIAAAFTALHVQHGDKKMPVKDVATLLQTEKTSPSALLSGVKEAHLERVLALCKDFGLERSSAAKAALLSNGDKWANSIFNAPLTAQPWCTPVEYVMVLRVRLGLAKMDVPTGVTCKCNTRQDVDHALKCTHSHLFYRRHNAIVLACAKLYRMAGSSVTIEPMVRIPMNGKTAQDKGRLDIEATYAGKKFLVDISVASTQVLAVKKVPFDNVTAGVAADQRYGSKVKKYGDRVKQRGDNLQVVAFDSAGCPAYKTKLELDAWIKNAREMEAADGADLLSFTELRARIVRELVRAQASALLRIRCEAINLV